MNERLFCDRARRTRRFGLAFVALVALASSGCGERLSEGECAQLLDHYTEKLIDQARPSAKPSQRIKWVNEARLKAARDPEFAACPERVRRGQFECALAAQTADDVERCLL